MNKFKEEVTNQLKNLNIFLSDAEFINYDTEMREEFKKVTAESLVTYIHIMEG